MTTKSYSKHKEFKEYSTSGTVPYTDEQFDMMKSELIPKGSKLNSLGRNGTGAGTREYHYEYKEEKHPSGKYDRKDLHTVEEFTIPAQKVPKASEASSYYYEREDRQLPALNTSTGSRTYNYETSTSSTPGYSKVKSTKVTKELSQNVDELDCLLDDLQKDQERQLYKSGYTSDTAESSSFDYKRGTPAKAPSSGYSTLKREELATSWGAAPTTEVRQELFREEKTESRVIPSPSPAPAPMCECRHLAHNTSTLSRSSTPMNKVTTTVKTYTYEVPAGQDPTTLPLPISPDHHHTYLSSTENLRSTSSNTLQPPPGGCQYCTHCNSHERQYRHVTSADEHSSERIVYPSPVNDPKPLPTDHHGHPPYGPSSYKFSETSYSSLNSSQRFPPASPPAHSPGPFPRPTTPSSATQQPPKRLDDLLADFPEARFPTQPDGVVRRKVEMMQENSSTRSATSAPPVGPLAGSAPASAPAAKPVGGSKNVAGPAVYYPPGHTPFAKKEAAAYQASAMQGGGAYASGRGMYEYESGSRSKEKHSETKTAVPICLPLCCAMPCVIM